MNYLVVNSLKQMMIIQLTQINPPLRKQPKYTKYLDLLTQLKQRVLYAQNIYFKQSHF